MQFTQFTILCQRDIRVQIGLISYEFEYYLDFARWCLEIINKIRWFLLDYSITYMGYGFFTWKILILRVKIGLDYQIKTKIGPNKIKQTKQMSKWTRAMLEKES